MNKNLPQIYKENIFKRFFNYIRGLFISKKNDNIEEVITADVNNENETKKNNFLQDIKIKDNKEFEKKQYMDNLKDNLQLLEECSNEKLEKILDYYVKENEQKKAILNKLNA